MTKTNVNIIGAGGFGKEVKSMLVNTLYQFAYFVDDDITKSEVRINIDQLNNVGTEGSSLIIAIGNSSIRHKVYSRLSDKFHFPIISHPSVISQDLSSIIIGEGSILCAGIIITCDVRLGKFCIVNLNCTIGHDVKIGDFCSLMPSVNISGNVNIGDGVFIGTGATVIQGITIGEGAIIGAGSVVLRDIPPNCTAVGVPATPIKFH